MTPLAGAPSRERLDAAVSLIVERLSPDQIILFGSGARNEMTPSSDLDVLVLKDEDGAGSQSTRHERWRCPDSGDQLDVVVMSRAMAERHRMSASYVQGTALEEGRTLYVRKGVTPTGTGPTCTWNGVEMVKTTMFEPDQAAELLKRAEAKWEDANRTRYAVDKSSTCSEPWSMRSRHSLPPPADASTTRTNSTTSGSKSRGRASVSAQYVTPSSSRS